MRGALYDNAQASAEAFVLAAAHTIEWTLKQHPGEVNVTVVVHTTNVPGAPNKPSDMNFIKLFVQVRSAAAVITVFTVYLLTGWLLLHHLIIT